jgi:hypothetical protein
MSDVFIDRRLQFGRAGEYAAAQPFGGDVTEESLHQPHAGALGARQCRQLAFLCFCQLNRRGNSQLLTPMQTEVEHRKGVMQLSSFKNQTRH